MGNITPIPSNLSAVESSKTEKTVFTNRIVELSQRLLKFPISQFKQQMNIKVNVINKEIENLEQLIEISKKKREEGEKVSKSLLVGTLVKSTAQGLVEKKEEYEKEIKTLRSALDILNQIEKLKIDGPRAFSSEILKMIFNLENQVKEILNLQTFPEKMKYQHLYDEIIHPYVELAKDAIKGRALNFSIQAAAAKGKAAQVGIQAIKVLSENKAVLQSSGVSAQEVFLLPEQEAVFKLSREKAKEEERLANDLFDLMSKQAVVGSFDIQKPSIGRFGFQETLRKEEREFDPDTIESPILEAINKNLSYEDSLLLEKHQTTLSFIDPNLKNYQDMLKQVWYLKFPGKNWEKISLKELQTLYLTDKLPPDASVGSSQATAIPFENHLLNETTLFKALTYTKTSTKPLLLSPDLSDPATREAYERCEQCKWSYMDSTNQKQEVDFRTLLENYLKGQTMQAIQPITTPSSKNVPNIVDQMRALNVPWKVISSELMQYKSGDVTELTGVQSKPFIADMILMKDFQKTPVAREAVLKKLTPDAEFNAILTGEVQLLDLHAGNLGIAPEPSVEYDRFKDLKFFINPFISMSFKELIIDYLEGKIPPTTIIEFTEGGQTINKQLSDLPELQKALDSPWRLVLFDTDLSISESNFLQVQTKRGVEEHLIPLRSVLLETSWKDQPLNKQTVERLMDSSERDIRVKNWAKKEDAPIYKRLSKQAKEEIEKMVEPAINLFKLSFIRKRLPDVTIKKMQQLFVENLSNMNNPQNLPLWKKLEEELSLVTILPEDTLETIAQRYHHTVDELEFLNPTLDFKPGQKITILYDLTSNSPEALRRRKHIAGQLFPRLTVRQQEALVERQNNRLTYLNSYKELAESTLQGDAFATQLEDFLKQSETPLSINQKVGFLVELSLNRSNSQNLLDLKQEICRLCQPTYFNLMKAMYPLLADAYALNEGVFGKDGAGINIGLYTNPLETVIRQAKLKGDPDILALADKMERDIAAIKDPAFFINLG